MDTRKLAFITRLTREDVAGLLEALVNGLKDGMLKVQKSGDTLELEVPRVVDLTVEAETNEERAVFAIEVSWRTNRAENPDMVSEFRDFRAFSATAHGKAGAAPAETAQEQSDAPAKKAGGTTRKTVAARKRAGAKPSGAGAGKAGAATSRTVKKKSGA